MRLAEVQRKEAKRVEEEKKAEIRRQEQWAKQCQKEREIEQQQKSPEYIAKKWQEISEQKAKQEEREKQAEDIMDRKYIRFTKIDGSDEFNAPPIGKDEDWTLLAIIAKDWEKPVWAVVVDQDNLPVEAIMVSVKPNGKAVKEPFWCPVSFASMDEGAELESEDKSQVVLSSSKAVKKVKLNLQPIYLIDVDGNNSIIAVHLLNKSSQLEELQEKYNINDGTEVAVNEPSNGKFPVYIFKKNNFKLAGFYAKATKLQRKDAGL